MAAARQGLHLLYDGAKEGKTPVVDIVFVHGLFGHWRKTWAAEAEKKTSFWKGLHSSRKDKEDDSKKAKIAEESKSSAEGSKDAAAAPKKSIFWPQDLLPSNVPDSRIFSWGYDVDINRFLENASQLSIYEHAERLAANVADVREESDEECRPIIFVVHSLGGIVVKEMLNACNTHSERLKNVLSSSLGIIFLGTPHRGSGIATYGKIAFEVTKAFGKRPNTSVLRSLEANDGGLYKTTQEFNKLYSVLPTKIRIYSFREEYPTLSVMIVDRDSASFGIGDEGPVAISADHRNMTKFPNQDDEGFKSVSKVIARWVREMKQQADDQRQRRQAALQSPAPDAPSHQDRPIALVEVPTVLPFKQDPDFVGREAVIETVTQNLDRHRASALVGLGGVGKSQIAIEHAHRARKADATTMVFWVHVGDLTRAKDSFRRIAKSLRLPGAEDEETPVIHLVSQRLSSESFGRWLLILDNLDDISVIQDPLDEGQTAFTKEAEEVETLADLIPSSSNGTVLITSRNREASRTLLIELGVQSAACLISVEAMSGEEALSLLKSRIPDVATPSETEALKLVKDLEYLPLAISQAGAYINKKMISVSKYRQIFLASESSKLKLLQEYFKDVRRDQRPHKAVLFTWNASFEQIRLHNPASAELLQVMSVYANQNIPIKLLANSVEPDSDVDELMLPLRQYHLVTARPSEESYDIHHFVQIATRFSMRESGALQTAQGTAVGALEATLSEFSLKEKDLYASIAPHASAIILCDFVDKEQLLQLSGVCLQMSTYWSSTLSLSKATDAATRAMEIRSAQLGKDHEDTLVAQYGLALRRREFGPGKLAVSITKDLLERLERLSDDEDAEDSKSSNLLADVKCMICHSLMVAGEYLEAEAWARKSLELYRTPQNPNKHAMDNVTELLSRTLQRQCRYDEAIEVARTGLEQAIRNYGREDTKVIEYKVLLGAIYSEVWDMDKAVAYLTEARAQIVAILGPDHPRTINVSQEIVLQMFRADKLEEALINVEPLLAQVQELYGPSHKDSLSILSLQGTLFNDLDRAEEGLQVHERALALRRQTLSDDHPDTLISMHQLAVSHMKLKHFNQGADLLLEALPRAKRALGLEHDYTIMMTIDYAGVLERQGKIDDALKDLRACYDCLLKQGDRRRKLFVDASVNLARCLSTAEQYDEALSLWRECIPIMPSLGKQYFLPFFYVQMAQILEKMQKIQEAEDAFLRAASLAREYPNEQQDRSLTFDYDLAEFYRRQSKFDQAESLFNDLRGRYQKAGLDKHPKKFNVLNQLAIVYRAQKKFDQAEALGRETFHGREALIPADRAAVCISMNNLAMVLYDMKKYDEAESLLHKAIAGKSEILGEDHKETRFTQNNLFIVLSAQSKWSEADKIFDDIFSSTNPECAPSWIGGLETMQKYRRFDRILACADHISGVHLPNLGEGNPAGFEASALVANALAQSGRTGEALLLYAHVFQPARSARHLKIKESNSYEYANLLSTQSDFASMEKFARTMSDELQERFGSGSRRHALVILTSALQRQNRPAEAMDIQHEVLLIHEDSDGLPGPGPFWGFRNYLTLASNRSPISPASEELILRYRDTLASKWPNGKDLCEIVSQIAAALVYKTREETIATCELAVRLASQRTSEQEISVLAARELRSTYAFIYGKYQEAAEEQREVLLRKRELLGSEDPTTVQMCHNLAMSLAYSGAVYEAVEVSTEALESRRKLLGEGHVHTLLTECNHGIIQLWCGQLSRSERTLRANIAARATLKPLPFNYYHSQNRLALTLMARGKVEEAHTILSEPCPEQLSEFAGNRLWALARTALLAQAKSGLGQHADAKAHSQEALQGVKAILGEKHFTTLSGARDVAAISRELGELEEAEDLAMETRRTAEEEYGSRHPLVLDLVRLLGLIYRDQGNLLRAEKMLGHALSERRETLRDDHPDVRQAERDYVLLLAKMRRASVKGPTRVGAQRLAAV